jgi:hypothetical protein
LKVFTINICCFFGHFSDVTCVHTMQVLVVFIAVQ